MKPTSPNRSPLFGHFRQAAVVLMVAAIVGTAPAAVDPPEIRVGSELDFRPYSFTDQDGQATGFSTDLIKAVAGAMGLRVRITTGPWDQVWAGLVSGQFDVLPTVARVPGREKLVDFSLPHTETFDSFFMRPGQPEIPGLAAAAGKEIVVLRSDAAHHELVQRKFAGKLILVDTIPDGLRLVAGGKHDAFLCSKLVGVLEMDQAGIKGIKPGPPIPDYTRVFSFAVQKGNAELLEKINQGLLIIKASGEYNQIYRRWLGIEEPWQRWRRYLWVTLAIVIPLAVLAVTLVEILRRLVRRRTRELAAEVAERRRAEAALQQLNAKLEQRVAERTAAARKSEQQQRRFYDSGLLGVIYWNTDGKITDANDKFLEMVGYSREDLAADRIDWVNMTPPEYRLLDEASVKELKATGVNKVPFEKEYIRKDGTRLNILIAGAMLDEVQFNGVAFVLDITKRKQAVDALRRSESLLRAVLDNSPDPIFLKDLDSRLLLANPATFVLIGKPPEECLGKTDAEFYDDVAAGGAIMENDRRIMNSGQMEIVEETVTGSTGTHVYLSSKKPYRDADGRVVGLVGVARDITERKRVERALQASEERFRRYFELGLIGMAITSPTKGLMEVNEELCTILGFQRAELLQKTWAELTHPDDLTADVTQFNRVMAGEIEGYAMDKRFIRKDGQIILSNLSVRALRRVDSSVDCFVALIQDITERKRAENALRASLHEKEVLLKEVHHRVKNNLQVVSSLISLQADRSEDAAQRGPLDDLRDQVRTMALVHDKLYQSESLAQVDFADYSRTLLDCLWRSHGVSEDTIRLTLDLQPVALSLHTALPCGLILNELVTNAMKHAFRDRAGGEITVALHVRPEGQVCLRVGDNGVGLPEGLDWRHTRSLGLQLVQILTGQLNGALDVHNRGGTEFQITFSTPETKTDGEDQHGYAESEKER